jgi:O-antigen ligase
MNMPSGGTWSMGVGDLLVFFGLIFLFFELLKSTSSQKVAIINHALSMGLFVLCLLLFLLLPSFATSTFFLIMVMVLLDVMAGFIVTILTARRDLDIGGDVNL